MDITVLIPTRGERINGIVSCINSIGMTDVKTKILKNTGGWLPEVNKILKDITGYMIMGADDMDFHPNAIKYAVNILKSNYPDGDGVVGFNQVTLSNFCKAGFVVMGRKFIDWFPDSRVYCPDYKHYFADTELFEYASLIKKFTYCPEAKVNHYHFSITGNMDSTAMISKRSYAFDSETYAKRQEKKFLWGRDFNRVND